MQKGIGASFYFIGLVALFVYTNTLIGDFTFDDNFAVVGVLLLHATAASWWQLIAIMQHLWLWCRSQTAMSQATATRLRGYLGMISGEPQTEKQVPAATLRMPWHQVH